ncbi:MAG: hypothetical protein HY769_05475 [Candidatus Stahlbacteria bacterium]|nr:hypothetical protein [Candidatus Stahlbacteria bacterium]
MWTFEKFQNRGGIDGIDIFWDNKKKWEIWVKGDKAEVVEYPVDTPGSKGTVTNGIRAILGEDGSIKIRRTKHR